jgi:hypothetical protein
MLLTNLGSSILFVSTCCEVVTYKLSQQYYVVNYFYVFGREQWVMGNL